MTLILGIDPGSRITGYGVVRDTGRNCEYVASGCIRTGNGSMAERLQIVFRGVREVMVDERELPPEPHAPQPERHREVL